MTTHLQRTNLDGFRWLLAGFGLILSVVAMMGALQLVSSTGSSQKGEGPRPLTPAIAMNNGNPSLFMFVPEGNCLPTQCRSTAELTNWLTAQVDGAVNVIEIPVATLPPDATPAAAPQYYFASAGLYPVEGVVEWLPPLSQTAKGYGLAAPVFVVLDADGDWVHSGAALEEVVGMISAEMPQ